jgi:MFS family permease
MTRRAAASSSAYAWLVVALLWVVAMLNYLDRLAITTMRDPIVAELHLSDKQFGLLTSVFLWVYAAVSPLGGFIADRLGRRGVILASLLFWSAATALSGWARSFHELLAARALMGVSEACYIPAALALIADYHPGPTRSLATGLHMSGVYTGQAVGGIGGYVAESIGWRTGFRLFGGVGIAYALVLALSLRDMGNTTLETSDADSKPRLADALAALLRLRGFQFLLALNILVGAVNWTIYGWLPTYLREHFQLGLGAAGLSATAYIQIASFAGVLIGGAWADRWSRSRPAARALVPALAFCIAGPCLTAAASTHVLPIAIAGLIVFGLARGSFDANQMPILRELAGPRTSATGYGLLNFVSTATGGIMVFAGGAMKDARLDLAYVFQACGVGLVFVAGLLLAASYSLSPEYGGEGTGRDKRATSPPGSPPPAPPPAASPPTPARNPPS